MATQAEIYKYAKLIVETHGGKMWYTLTETRHILGIGENTIARKLHDAGVGIQKKGRAKMVSAFGVAECGLYNTKAAIDNISR